ncbi:MAG: N-acetylmuramic acid 6-phosphate etherase [Planctomycetes bacterium]|nr:N-acetylmuramic acid 6-phosphate etherase [Planctomycetota bacterium]
MSQVPSSRGHLATESHNERSAGFDALSIADAVELMQREDERVHAALAAARADLARAIELVVARLRGGGRLFYVGAGTSGRLGLLDAVECPPTFQTDPSLVQAVLAGGAAAVTGAVEGAEDSATAAGEELARRGLCERDIVFGIAAGGTTPFVHGALDFARSRGAATVFLACVPREQAPDRADVSVRIVSGPEVISGSTRLKAGTVTKLALNTVTTVAMAQLGKVHGNLMVDVDTSKNTKLVERGARIVAALAGVGRDEALALLAAAGGQVKVAVVMSKRRLPREQACEHLRRCGGLLRRALA